MAIKSREQLVEEAKNLGIAFHHKLGAEKLAELIAAHKSHEIEPEQAPGAITEESSGEPECSAKDKQKGKAKPPSRFNKFGGR